LAAFATGCMIVSRCPRFAAHVPTYGTHFFGAGSTSSTAVADFRVGVRCSHGSPDNGLFRRFRLAEDKSAGDKLPLRTRRQEISAMSGPRLDTLFCVRMRGYQQLEATHPVTPPLGLQSHAWGVIAELHQHDLSQFVSCQGTSCMQI
jgi:hypothetical protein